MVTTTCYSPLLSIIPIPLTNASLPGPVNTVCWHVPYPCRRVPINTGIPINISRAERGTMRFSSTLPHSLPPGHYQHGIPKERSMRLRRYEVNWFDWHRRVVVVRVKSEPNVASNCNITIIFKKFLCYSTLNSTTAISSLGFNGGEKWQISRL